MSVHLTAAALDSLRPKLAAADSASLDQPNGDVLCVTVDAAGDFIAQFRVAPDGALHEGADDNLARPDPRAAAA